MADAMGGGDKVVVLEHIAEFEQKAYDSAKSLNGYLTKLKKIVADFNKYKKASKTKQKIHAAPQKSSWHDELRLVWQRVHDAPECAPFRKPVDPGRLRIQNYYEVVQNPMDMRMILSKLDRAIYRDPWEFCDDMYLMLDNVGLINRKNSRVEELFVKHINPVMRALGYCCGERFAYTPPAVFCAGKPMCAILRDEQYYCYELRYGQPGFIRSFKHIYCKSCFAGFPEEGVNINNRSHSSIVPKRKFRMLSNDKVDHEPFEICKICYRRWHRICAMHSKEITPEAFECQNCRKARKMPEPENIFTAKKLPQCFLSDHIESRVKQLIVRKCGPRVAGRNQVLVRVLCSTDKEFEVKPLMKQLCGPDFPEKFPYRQKAIFAFQVVDGAEICFFGLYVHEYGSECPDPNKRCVYMSYLDSVNFFQPRDLRTDVYHEIILGYLEYARNLGYVNANIWVCPPAEGSNGYIFNCRPQEQKNPDAERLYDWYKKMLDKGIAEKIVSEYKDIWKQARDENLANVKALPYFEGDYWPDAIESYIREVEEERTKNKENTLQQQDDALIICSPNHGGKQKGTKNVNVTTSSQTATASVEKEVTQKLFDELERHKYLFFTVQLHNNDDLKEISDPDPVVSSELMDHRGALVSKSQEEHWEFSSMRRAKYSTYCLCYALHTELSNINKLWCNKCDAPAALHCNECDDFDLCSRCFELYGHEHLVEVLNS
ncbi:hypothetical protein QR680_005972 [Steinernema hermaphroditum]|uniref:histone acetyltransferase n=1 Tax=Steinernema hermaphroditum TaxID=289476 RepID=A0AA39HTV6_9BILA|nr:hypothetical protein QR680_005972 [Steinernema hermaphroditum]